MPCDVRSSMLQVRANHYERGDRETTIREYQRILENARADKDVSEGDILLCLGGIAMVLHESNRLAEAINTYDEALTCHLSPEMRARFLQNKSMALAANHAYDAAVKAAEESLHYAQESKCEDLINRLKEGLQKFQELAKEKPEKIILVGMVKRLPDLEDKLKHP